MNNYHVYEAIGRGKHSAVYKARKKKTIEYYAVKSVDKSQRSKVLQEVRMLHSLDHPNVLKFFSWYETSAHLWLILEYCVGGSLMKLLDQDKSLPENSIHELASDLVKALQFLHAKGIIYCDLKPSNMLLDEHGCSKLCDFGLARRLSDMGNSSTLHPQSKRGTPCYMAPELFQDGGIHSYASDFWALGCVLFECYTGKPPFVGNEFTLLVKSIISDPAPPLPGNPSRSFVNLINSLLMKDPAERIQWPELCEHAFWRSKFVSVSLPPQPAFDNMLQLSIKPCLSERNGDRPSHQRTPQKCRDHYPSAGCKQDDNSTLGGKAFETPAKNMQSGKKFSCKASGKADAPKGVNLLRLSRMAKLNLRRDNERENYRRHAPETSENDTEVNIENNDMELDFTENPEDDAPDDVDGTETPTPNEKMTAQIVDENFEDTEHSTNDQDSLGDNATNVGSNDLRKLDQDSSMDQLEATPTPSRKAQQMKTNAATASDSSSSNLSEVFWHPTDLSVKPVMPSKKSDKTNETAPTLPFEAIPASDYVKLSSEQLNSLNSKIVHLLSGSSHISDKQNGIRYLEILAANSDAANVITNGPVMLLLVKMLRLSKTYTLRIQIVALMGLLIRHSTQIDADLASSGIVNALTDGLRDKQDKVRRFCMAALGELLFYISTQNDHTAKAIDTYESPSKDSKPTSGWQIPNSVISLISSILRKGEDDLAQLYALRTIENICSQGGDWTSRFAGQEVIVNLCYIYRSTAKQETTRLIAGSCLVRLARFSPSCTQFLFEKMPPRDIASRIVKGNTREQQISLNFLMSFLSSNSLTNMSKHFLSLAEEKALVPSILSLIEQGTEVLRGKALMFVAFLCKNNRRWLPQFLGNSKLLSVADRLAKEKDGFIQQCMEAFVQLVASIVPSILEAVSADVQQIMSGKRHGPMVALTGRGNPKISAHLFSVVLNLLGSSSFKHRVINNHVLLQLANLTKLLESHLQARDDFQLTLLRVLELAIEESSIINDDPKIFTSRILPSLAIIYKGNKDGNARFLCLKILFDVMVVIFDNTSLVGDKQTKEDLKSISHAHLLPLYPALIEDEDPIPMYAQKLIVMLIEINYITVSDILRLNVVTQCFEFLLGDLSNANVSNINLCLALASAPEMGTNVLSHLQVVRRICNLLEFVNAKEMLDFLEPTLALCKVFILRGIGSNKGLLLCKEPALLGNIAFDTSVAVDQHHCLHDVSDFVSSISVFLELNANPDMQIMDLASECLILLLKAAPREATMGILMNLPKISSLLEFLNDNAFGLQMLRLLYGLAFSSRQYLSQAMIMSISIPALVRIEALLSALKSSSDPDLAAAAVNLGTELQRLPRCL